MKCQAAILAICSVFLVSGGPPGQRVGRIVGGTPAERGEFRWHASVQFMDGFGTWFHQCDAAIISSEFILTDWFCTHIIEFQPSRVVAGTLSWANPGTVHNVTETFDADSLALLRVDPPFLDNFDVGPVQLPAPNAETPQGTLLTVSGWEESSPYVPSEVFVKLSLPAVSKADCSLVYPELDLTNRICAGGGSSGAGLCTSPTYGAPLVSNNELRGIFYMHNWNVCQDPGVYNEVSRARDWINEITGV